MVGGVLGDLMANVLGPAVAASRRLTGNATDPSKSLIILDIFQRVCHP